MTVKLMRTAMPLAMVACLVMTAGAALTSLPDSSHYSGISYYATSPSSGKIQAGRVEFAVYDTATNPDEFIGTDGFTNPGTGRYVYAYQIFNYSTNDYGMTNTSVPYFVIQSIGANSIASNDEIGTISSTAGSVNSNSYSLNASGTSVVFAFDNGILAAGKNSWYLILSSNQDWKVGSYSMESPPIDDGEVPGPKDVTASGDTTKNNNPVVPEPASLFLMGLGAASLFKRKQK
jgi:hypothetical protein